MAKNRGMRSEVVTFALAMETELQENDHKRGWQSLSIKWLMNRLQQEKRELAGAIARGAGPDFVESEAADLGNFAMMISENYRTEYYEKQRHEREVAQEKADAKTAHAAKKRKRP